MGELIDTTASSDVTSQTDKDGRVVDLVYDNLHRETSEHWMSGGTVVYAIDTAYDADNEVTTQSSPDSVYAMDGVNGTGPIDMN